MIAVVHRNLLGALSLFFLLAAGTGQASAATLPLFDVQHDGEVVAWWVEQDSSPTGELLEQLWSSPIFGECAPATAQTAATISRVLRRPSLSKAQALSLADMYGCSRALRGAAQIGSAQRVPGVDGWIAPWSLQIEWLDVQRAMSVGDLAVSGYGAGVSADDAQQNASRIAARRLVRWLVVEAQSAEAVELPLDDHALVVHSPEGAAPYVAFRQLLHQIYPQLREPAETWATEGGVALTFEFSEGGSWDGLYRILESRAGTTIDNVTIYEVERSGELMRVLVRWPLDEGQL